MDELKFKERIYADPFTEDSDIIAAAADNPELARLRVEAQSFDSQISATMKATAVPPDLMEKLLKIPSTDANTEQAIANIGQADGAIMAAPAERNADNSAGDSNIHHIHSRTTRPAFLYVAMAACLVIGLGVSFSYFGNFGNLSNNGAPSAADLAFGDEILNHLRLDTDAVAAMGSTINLQPQTVNTVLNHAGVQLVSTNSLLANAVKFAEPCVIIPSNQSAHLVIQGSQGAINVIVINNSPVASEFRIANEHQSGLVIPMGEGNLVLVGEGEEDLDQYSELFSDNLRWSI